MTDDAPLATEGPETYIARESSVGDAETVLLFMEASENRRLLGEWLSGEYDVRTAEGPPELGEEFDLCIVDGEQYRQHHQHLQDYKEDVDPTFLPVLLTASADSRLWSRPDVWEVVDDVVETPIRKPELRGRLESLLRQRTQSLQLREREAQLREVLADLRVKENAMDAAPVGITIAGAGGTDNELTYVNSAFEELTGYSESEALGRDCRFLQGPNTDEQSVAEIRRAIDEGEQVSVDLINYEKCGRQFWNRVAIAPVRSDRGDVTHFVGFQTDVTDRRIREQRLDVLNRVLRHNLRNEIGVVQGYCELLEDDVTEPPERSYLDRVHSAATELTELSEKVHHVDQVMRQVDEDTDGVSVTAALQRALSKLDAEFPDTSIEVDVRDENLPPVPSAASIAFEELVSNALERCDGTDADPEIVVSWADDFSDTVELVVDDYSPDVPDPDRAVLAAGEETALDHADGLGLWLADWVVRTTGGTIDVTEEETGESTLTVRLPIL